MTTSSKFKAIQQAFNQKSLMEMLKNAFTHLTDIRTGKNTQYAIVDAALSAFAVFFTQNPSFLAHQRYLQQHHGCNNLRSLFGVYKNPSDNQIRNLLDAVNPSELYGIFFHIFNMLHISGYFKKFTVLNGSIAVAMDGVEYFSSQEIHCECCSTQTLSNGKIRYSHKMATFVIVSPNQSEVIPLAPEFITPQDGVEKQDCESRATKRWLNNNEPLLKFHNITFLGDDLFCHQPHCELILKQKQHFILVCKSQSHPTLYEWLAGFAQSNHVRTLTKTIWNGRYHIVDTYRFMNQLPIREGADAMMVNWCELTSVRAEDGKVLYHNAFATDYELTKNNVMEIVAVGRSRWKIENENNNTLKTKGYNFDHNFGHGKKNLSSVLVT